MGISARHRRHRPGHPFAADLRRAAVADDRPGGGGDRDHGRHRARTGGGLFPRHRRDHDHAADGHHPDAAEPAARDRDSRDPRPRPDERDAGGRRGGAAALCADHARRGDHRDLEGLRHRRARERRNPAAAHVLRGAAQLCRAADRPGVPGRVHRHPRRGGAGLSGPGRAAARIRMGDDAGGRPRVRASRVVGRDVSGPDDPADRPRVQPAGRRPARRARSRS